MTKQAAQLKRKDLADLEKSIAEFRRKNGELEVPTTQSIMFITF
jgi:hypothetical protein